MDTLTHLPKDLETIYNQILQRIKAREMPYAKIILWWLMLGLQPLTIQELSIVVMFNPSTGFFDSTLALAQPEDVMQACSSLITSTDGNIVTLAHASVKEYFCAQPRPWNNDLIDLSDSQIGHAMIAYLCLKYLFQDDWNANHSSKKFPLEDYSVQHWPYHYKHSNRNSILQDTVVKFFQMDQGYEGPYTTWVNLHYSDAQLYTWDFDRELSPFFHAGHLGLDDIIQCLILNGTWSVIYDKTLNAAALEGHINIIKILLDNGANAAVQNDFYGNALHSASLKGHAEIVKLLLERGMDVNAQGGKYCSALQAASYEGHIEVVHQLLNHGADVNAPGGDCGNALQAASLNGYINIVNLLLEKGADVSARAGLYGNALQAASHNGHSEIVEILFSKGLGFLNEKIKTYSGALQAASLNGHIKIVLYLLDKGGDDEFNGDEYGNALQASSLNGYIDIVKLLIAKGADVNAKGGPYGNALQAASFQGHAEIVTLLLEKGADVNAQGGFCGNALQAASINAHVDIVEMLLERKAHVNVDGGEYGFPLQAAAACLWMENITTIQLLLNHGAHVNAEGGIFGNALEAAKHHRHNKIISILLRWGAIDMFTYFILYMPTFLVHWYVVYTMTSF
jgi:ankyrin repeat protein